MINKCFVTTLDCQVENNSKEYLFGQKFEFANWSEGTINFRVNRIVDVEIEVITNIEGITLTYLYDSGQGHTLRAVGLTGKTGYILIKDMRTLFIHNIIDSEGNYPSRRASWTTEGFATCDINVAKTFSNKIRVRGNCISGNIIDFSKFINCTEINLYHSATNFAKIEGSLESLAQGMIDYGKTSGTLTVNCNGKVTVNDEVIAGGVTKTITFSGDSYVIA